ncbi:MAG TPA: VWA domain-containing protein [Pyrinomonadaceae bacterium]|nr:VWA domain-containing protein [Pyrinomonadaceae bacterium]
MKSNATLALLLLFCLFLTALAQSKPAAPPQPQKPSEVTDDDVVRITTNLVQVDAVVTKDGKVVPNLTADDFEIFEDGKKQTITSFAYISNLPTSAGELPAKEKTTNLAPAPRLNPDDPRRTVALVVDDLGLSAESMHQVRKQLRKFIAEELQPNDLVAVIRTGGELGALQQFTNDRRLLDRAVDRLRWNMCSRGGVSVLPRVLMHPSALEDPELNCGGNSIFKTMKALRFILDALAQLPGRKSMVLLSDSLPVENQELHFDNDALNNFPDTRVFRGLLLKIAEKAIRASVVIYAVDTQGLQYTGLTAADNTPVTRASLNSRTNAIMSTRSALLWRRREGGELIARQTGGFQVRNSNSFELPRILRDQSGYYLLGYRPTNETFNRRFHHIKAKVKRSGMTLRTRYGFFGVSEEEVRPTQVLNPTSTNLALASPFGAQDIEVNLVSFFTSDKVSGSMVRSFVYIDPRGLTFENVDGRRQTSFELHGVIFGDNGTVVEQISRSGTLSLNEPDYEQAMRNGMALKLDMPAKRPGAYQIRVATRDKSSGKIGSAGQFVEVPDLKKNRLAVSGIVLSSTAGSPRRDVNEIIERLGTRTFDPNTDLHFAFVTYNAASTSNLVMEAKLFRDGKSVYSGPEVPINAGNQADPGRLLVNGSLRLNSDLEPGNYYLQVVIMDKGAKNKTMPVVQWIDFDIVK